MIAGWLCAGLFVSPKSPNSIVRSIEKICAKSANYEMMSKASRCLYEQRFKREVHLKALISALLG